MRKRNKRTEVMAHTELAPLTEHILASMGQEGDSIRKQGIFGNQYCPVNF